MSVNAQKLFNLGEYKEALSIYLYLLSQNLDESKLYGNVAMTYEMLNEYELAVANYKKSIRLDEKNIRSVDNLARVYIDIIKDYKIASQYLDYAIKTAPNDPEAYNLYGNLSIIEKKFEIAERYLKKSILLDGMFFKNYYDLAVVYHNTNNNEKAIEALEKCLELKSDFKPAVELMDICKEN